MTGKQFKSLAKRLHGHKWAKLMGQDLNVHRTTVWKLCTMATIPKHYERKIGEILRRGK